MSAQAIDWIESGGGPLLFAPSSALSAWQGIGASTTSPGTTDYERACAVADEIGVVRIGGVEALVLGDEPDRSALVTHTASNILVLRWRWAKSEQSLLSAIDLSEIDRLPSEDPGSFKTVADEYLLFDAAYKGVESSRALRTKLVGGVCSFDTVHFRPDAGTYVLIHRLRIA